jgi:hypothetical protein
MWDPQRLTTLSASMACYRESFTLPYLTYIWEWQWTGIAQSEKRLSMEWRTGFDSRQVKWFTQEEFWAGPVFYPEEIGRYFPGDKVAGALSWGQPPSSIQFNKVWRFSSFPPHVFNMLGTWAHHETKDCKQTSSEAGFGSQNGDRA